jgi:hypothetical protein
MGRRQSSLALTRSKNIEGIALPQQEAASRRISRTSDLEACRCARSDTTRGGRVGDGDVCTCFVKQPRWADGFDNVRLALATAVLEVPARGTTPLGLEHLLASQIVQVWQQPHLAVRELHVAVDSRQRGQES